MPTAVFAPAVFRRSTRWARSRSRAALRRPRSVPGRVRGAARPVRQRQVDTAEHPGRTRCARRAAGAGFSTTTGRRRRGRADPLSPRARRLRLPVLQPDPSLTARENVALVTEIADASDDAPRRRWSWSASATARPFPGPALRRRAAAGRHRPRHRQAARGAAVRRAHRRARLSRPACVVLEGSPRVNRELGTTTAVITHNAAIAGDGGSRHATAQTVRLSSHRNRSRHA